MVYSMYMLRLSVIFNVISDTENVVQVKVSTYHLLTVPGIE